MTQRLQFGYPSFDVLSGVAGIGKIGIIEKRGPRATPIAGTAPILHVGQLQLGAVVVGDAPFVGMTMDVTVVLTEMHLLDVEIDELAFVFCCLHYDCTTDDFM
jgi:hypothetical protein